MATVERHGVYTSEVRNSVITVKQQSFTLPVVYGTAPIHLSTMDAAPVHVPILTDSLTEAKSKLGYSDDWSKYTLCEVMHSHFELYKQSTIVFINVLDPSKHKTEVAAAPKTFVDGMLILSDDGIIPSTLMLTPTEAGNPYIKDQDYTFAYDKTGHMIVSAAQGGRIGLNDAVQVAYSKLAPEKAQSTDLIGGIDASTGRATGFELLNQIVPRFGLIPGIVLAPGFTQDPDVGIVLTAKASNINGHFKAQTITDLPPNQKYTDVGEWKTTNGYINKRQFNLYPKVKRQGRTYWFSTHLAGVITATDGANDGVPAESPSNKRLQIDGMENDNGELFLGPDTAGALNAQGIITGLNLTGTWTSWGNRTAAFPDEKDPENAFIPVRRMFDWIANVATVTYWSYLDGVITTRMIEAVTDQLNVWMNGLKSRGFILGGRVGFLKDENPDENLMDGKLKFHIFVTPPSPAQTIEFLLEYDRSYLSGLTV